MELTNKTSKRKDSLKIFFLTLSIVFIRFILITPIDFSKNGSEHEMELSLKSAVYVALLFAFSVVVSAAAAKLYSDSKSKLIIYPLLLIIADPIFCFSLSTRLMLVVSGLAVVLYLLLMNRKSRIFGCICVPLFALVCTFLKKGFAFSLVPLFVLVCLLLLFEGSGELNKKIGITVIACTIVFALIGIFLDGNIESSQVLSSVYNFVATAENEHINIHQSKNVFLILLSALPSVAFGTVVLSLSSKIKSKNDNSYAVYNATGAALLIGVAGVIFFQSEAFLSFGIIVAVAIMTLVLTGNVSVEGSLGRFDAFVKKNTTLCFGIAIIVEIICCLLMYNYLSTIRLLDYVVTLI